MKTKYKWMYDGKEFNLPNLNKLNPQRQLDVLHIKYKAEQKYKDIKPEGIRPKDDKDLNEEWRFYLNMHAVQSNIDIVVYGLKIIDREVTKEIIMENLDTNEKIAEVLNRLFRVGKSITPEKKEEKKTEEPQKSKS